jgi:hypothetical protein
VHGIDPKHLPFNEVIHAVKQLNNEEEPGTDQQSEAEIPHEIGTDISG